MSENTPVAVPGSTTASAENPASSPPGIETAAPPQELVAPSVNDEPLYINQELLENAERMLSKRLASTPQHLPTLNALLQVYRKLGDIDQSLTMLNRILEIAPQDHDALYLRAILSGEVPPQQIRPAPFVFIRNFLPPEQHATFMPFVTSMRDKFVPALVGEGVYNPNVRESLELPGDAAPKTLVYERVTAMLPEILQRLRVARFRLDTTEVKLRVYQDGHFFRAHMDSPNDRISPCKRMVSFVYFFHKQPKPFSGGDLLLFDSDVESNRYSISSLTRVVPEDNCIVIFPSAYWHCVVPLRCPSGEFEDSRFVINGHVHRHMKNDEKRAEAKDSAATTTTTEAAAVATST